MRAIRSRVTCAPQKRHPVRVKMALGQVSLARAGLIKPARTILIPCSAIVGHGLPRRRRRSSSGDRAACQHRWNGAGRERRRRRRGRSESPSRQLEVTTGARADEVRTSDRVVLQAPGTTEQLRVFEVPYERIPVKPFSEPPGAGSAPKTRPRNRRLDRRNGRLSISAPAGRPACAILAIPETL